MQDTQEPWRSDAATGHWQGVGGGWGGWEMGGEANFERHSGTCKTTTRLSHNVITGIT